MCHQCVRLRIKTPAGVHNIAVMILGTGERQIWNISGTIGRNAVSGLPRRFRKQQARHRRWPLDCPLYYRSMRSPEYTTVLKLGYSNRCWNSSTLRCLR